MVARLSTFTNDVESTPLVGFVTTTKTPVVATDNIVVAIGKLQAQINAEPTPTSSIINALVFG